MVYKEIPIDLIDPNPFQTRVSYDEDVLIGIMATAGDELGLRVPPLVRPINKRYQIASGHGRIQAFRALNKKTVFCRVEQLSDAQMKKEVLVENVNRSDLTEDELWIAVEQYREELGLEVEDKGFVEKLSKATGIKNTTLTDLYDVKYMREIIEVAPIKLKKKPPARIIRATIGLEDTERVKLIKKAQERDWSREATTRIKQAIKDMEPDVKQIILEKEHTLTPKIIEAVSKLDDADTQKQIITFIQIRGLDEKLALEEIERLKENQTILETRIIDEAKEVLEEFREIERKVMTWGVNHYGILGEIGWAKARPIFDRIEKRMQWLKQL